MIKIRIEHDHQQIKQVSIVGHADYDKYGKDIVCAAVSSIVITTVNAMMKIDQDSIDYDNSHDLIIKINKHMEVTDLLIQNMVDLLKELEEQYPKNIKFEN
ncbi:MAG: ribosomal-processing cysteine protease Prp [Bacilli bacterium]|nr:ribosomal-processing cysteine protease Prp [Bacilli bacterium]MDD4808993.1 ribosomal-processing cysteine protease Prp [Bacilli bacterium]